MRDQARETSGAWIWPSGVWSGRLLQADAVHRRPVGLLVRWRTRRRGPRLEDPRIRRRTQTQLRYGARCWLTRFVVFSRNVCHRPVFSASSSVLYSHLRLPPAVLVSRCPYLLFQISLPGVLWSSSSSVAMWWCDQCHPVSQAAVEGLNFLFGPNQSFLTPLNLHNLLFDLIRLT